MTLRENLTDLSYWWRREIDAMLPLRRRSRRQPAAATLRLRRDGILVEPAKTGAAILAADAADAVGQLRNIRGRLHKGAIAVDIVVERDRFLKRTLSGLRLPRSRLSAMAKLDMHASTPFQTDQVHLLFGRDAWRSAGSSYYIVKKDLLDPVIAALTDSRIAVGEIRFADDEGETAAGDADQSRISPPPVWHVLAQKAAGAGIAIVLAGVAFTIGHAHWRYAEAERLLDAQLDIAHAEAAEVKRMIDDRNRKIAQISAVREEKKGIVPLVGVLEEMARVIPDSTWLTDITFSENTITFSGFSQSAADLIPVLDRSSLFSAPTFRTPVVRASNQEGERFTITMEIKANDG